MKIPVDECSTVRIGENGLLSGLLRKVRQLTRENWNVAVLSRYTYDISRLAYISRLANSLTDISHRVSYGKLGIFKAKIGKFVLGASCP